MTFVRSVTTYEIEQNGNKYQIVVPSNAPLGEAYDVMYKFLTIISEQAKVASEALKPKEEPKADDLQ